MSFAAGIPIIGDLIKLGSELIEDPDKKNEYAHKALEATLDYQKTIISTKTSPKVDAFVKIMYAFSDIIQKVWRPLIGGAMTAFGAYCHYKGIDVGDASQIIFDGAFPAWGVSRHATKKDEEKRKQADDEWWDENSD